MRISVDADACCAAGQCVTLAPDVFDQSEEDGRVVLLTVQPPAALEGAVREAAAACPASCIRLSPS
nr:ferredoxin [Actinoalloteichus spitiensis]